MKRGLVQKSGPRRSSVFLNLGRVMELGFADAAGVMVFGYLLADYSVGHFSAAFVRQITESGHARR